MKMKETEFEDGIELEGDESLVNILDRIFICLRDFSDDYLDNGMRNRLLNEMSITIQSKLNKPIPSIYNWLGLKHEGIMSLHQELMKKMNEVNNG